jgi:hypothetical protein
MMLSVAAALINKSVELIVQPDVLGDVRFRG